MIDILKEYDDYIISTRTDTKGVINFASGGFCKISGYTKEEILGKNHNIIRDPSNDPQIFKDMWEKLINGETVYIDKLSNKAKDGNLYYVKSKIYPIYKKNKLIGYGSLRTDITDKVKIEKMYQFAAKKNISMKEINTELKQNLHKSKEELVLFKNDVISVFSHELKTPLNAILNFAEYISKSMNKELTPQKIEKIKELANGIYKIGNTQLDMINTMLKLIEIKSGTLEVHKESLNLYEMLQATINNYQGISQKEVKIDIDKTIIVYADKKICNTIFANLYSNALKYAKSKVLISAKTIDNKVVISIEDDGPGIPKEKERIIFDMFVNIDQNALLNMNYETLGIGLYTTKLLADKCGRDLIVEKSALLGGAAFKIIESK